MVNDSSLGTMLRRVGEVCAGEAKSISVIVDTIADHDSFGMLPFPLQLHLTASPGIAESEEIDGLTIKLQHAERQTNARAPWLRK